MYKKMIQKTFVQGIKKEHVEDRLVWEIIEIMDMINMVEKASGENQNQKTERLESLLQTLRLEMVKRAILLAEKHGLNIKFQTVLSLQNSGEKLREPFYTNFSRLEEELNRAYHMARDMLDNLSRLV